MHRLMPPSYGEGGGIIKWRADVLMLNQTSFASKQCTVWKVGHFYFYDNLGKSGPNFTFFFTVKFRKDLREKLELKLSPHLKFVAALPCEKQVVDDTALQHS